MDGWGLIRRKAVNMPTKCTVTRQADHFRPLSDHFLRYNVISLSGSCDSSVGSAALVLLVILVGFKTLLWLVEQAQEVVNMSVNISWSSIAVRAFLLCGETIWAVGTSVVAAQPVHYPVKIWQCTPLCTSTLRTSSISSSSW